MEYDLHIMLMNEKIREYGLNNEAIQKAMENVIRHHFVPENSNFKMDEIYGNHPLPIGYDQTISQPYTVAFMLDLLELNEGMNILEVGAGSGWNAALIKELVGKNGKVTAIEYVKELSLFAKKNIIKAGYSNIELVCGDGSIGYKKNAPYDRIIATCACPKIPNPWIEQLKEGGIIVAPVGDEYTQEMVKYKKISGKVELSNYGSFQFVPLVGRFGFKC